MRKITISAAVVAGVATAGLLAMPIASAVADDDVDVKRDEDTPSLTTVVDDDDLDGNDPTNTNGPTNPTNGPTNPTNGPTNITQDVTDNDVTANDVTSDSSGDD